MRGGFFYNGTYFTGEFSGSPPRWVWETRPWESQPIEEEYGFVLAEDEDLLEEENGTDNLILQADPLR